MGCDIHAHVEVKMNGKWEHYSFPSIRRDYDLFAKMAGVRNYGEVVPLAERRGTPADISAVTRWDLERSSGWHSHSWLTQGEIVELMVWWEARELETRKVRSSNRSPESFEREVMGNYLAGNSFRRMPEGIEDVRLVFWFDC